MDISALTQSELLELGVRIRRAEELQQQEEIMKWRQREEAWQEGKRTKNYVGFYTGVPNKWDCGCHGNYHDSCYS